MLRAWRLHRSCHLGDTLAFGMPQMTGSSARRWLVHSQAMQESGWSPCLGPQPGLQELPRYLPSSSNLSFASVGSTHPVCSGASARLTGHTQTQRDGCVRRRVRAGNEPAHTAALTHAFPAHVSIWPYDPKVGIHKSEVGDQRCRDALRVSHLLRPGPGRGAVEGVLPGAVMTESRTAARCLRQLGRESASITESQLCI